MYYEVIPTKIFRADASVLTYSSPENLKPGQLVLVPLGKTSCPGIVLKKVQQPPFKTREIKQLLYKTPLPDYLLKSLLWLSSFYLSPLPSVASLFLPVGVEKKRRKTMAQEIFCSKTRTKPERETSTSLNLNPAQLSALSSLESLKNPTRLLYGITGSGKTNIYLELARKTLEKNQSVILLVPEIALTSQLVSVFESTFKQQVTLIHSKLTESSRHQIWESLLLDNSPRIVVGPRSALLAPLKNLGLIIIDEAHESAYYQENAPKYSSLRLASFIAKTLRVPCILGTATPLVSDYYLASAKNSVVPLKIKAKSSAIKPDLKIIDFKSRDSFSKNRYFSNPLLSAIKSNLKNHYQTLIFHNRRGSAPITLCEHCGWQAFCPNCFLPLTLHSDSYSLICHTCGLETKIPTSCPNCNSPSILHKGFGTKLLESELKKLFKDAKIARFDADNKKTDSLDALYDEVKSGKIDILIGTQTLARGLDLPRLATVGVVQADSGLSLPDFSAEEKTFELLAQVIGRVGRGHLPTASVFVQTYKPDSPAINFALASDYDNFYTYELTRRKKAKFPPFTYLAKVSVTYKTEQTTLKKIRSLRRTLSSSPLASKIEISSPTPTFHEHTTSGFTWQLVLKSSSRANLLKLLSSLDLKSVKVAIDPPSLL
ncbi:primosomal protein N' [Candidatus Saccharibacteria bacterium]|nr:primosomal protein N' [Candidatus Saccharibacteria bacterium]